MLVARDRVLVQVDCLSWVVNLENSDQALRFR